MIDASIETIVTEATERVFRKLVRRSGDMYDGETLRLLAERAVQEGIKVQSPMRVTRAAVNWLEERGHLDPRSINDRAEMSRQEV